LLTQPILLEPLAAQFAVATGQPALLKNPNSPDWLSAISICDPADTMCSHCWARSHAPAIVPLFAFRIPRQRMQEVVVRREVTGLPIGELTLSSDAEAWLTFIRDECATSRASRLQPALGYTPSEHLLQLQRRNLDFLRHVNVSFLCSRKPTSAIHQPRALRRYLLASHRRSAKVRTDGPGRSLEVLADMAAGRTRITSTSTLIFKKGSPILDRPKSNLQSLNAGKDEFHLVCDQSSVSRLPEII